MTSFMAPDVTRNKNSGHTFYRKFTKSSNQQVEYNHEQNKTTAMGAHEQIFKHHPENDRMQYFRIEQTVSVIIPANNQMTARITSVVGMFIWKGHPLRAGFQGWQEPSITRHQIKCFVYCQSFETQQQYNPSIP
jgi:hypothetical protein